MRIDSYIVCCTPRTGSTLLCSLLNSTGVAGKPESFFRSQDLDRRALEWNIRQPDGSYKFEEFLSCVTDIGRTPNGVLAVRVMWGTMEELVDQLRSLGEDGNDKEVLSSIFGVTLFVYLYRRDVVAQAVSRAKSEQTNVWHITSESAQSCQKNAEVHYNKELIESFVHESVQHNEAWNQWFSRIKIEPLRLTYEELDQDNAGATRRVLDYLGLKQSASRIEAANTRMADATSEEWVKRYKKEPNSLK